MFLVVFYAALCVAVHALVLPAPEGLVAFKKANPPVISKILQRCGGRSPCAQLFSHFKVPSSKDYQDLSLSQTLSSRFKAKSGPRRQSSFKKWPSRQKVGLEANCALQIITYSAIARCV
jgi:hypothetical protein